MEIRYLLCLFSLYLRSELIEKQEVLQELLNQSENKLEENIEIAEDNLVFEEYLDDDDDSNFTDDKAETVEYITLPSLKNLKDPQNNDSIIKLINEIEEKNQLILESSKPRVRTKSTKSLKSSQTVREDLIFEKAAPKLILGPSTSEQESIVLFSQDYKCEICQLKFNSDFRLQRHKISFHPLKNPMRCCGQTFDLMRDYKKHQASLHPVLIECSKCGKKLKSKKTFLVHKRSHYDVSDRRFKCSHPNCSKAFNFKAHLENHERVHSGYKPYGCNQCSSSFAQIYQLTLHNRKHDREKSLAKSSNLVGSKTAEV